MLISFVQNRHDEQTTSCRFSERSGEIPASVLSSLRNGMQWSEKSPKLEEDFLLIQDLWLTGLIYAFVLCATDQGINQNHPGGHLRP